jgi:hypothetical protein
MIFVQTNSHHIFKTTREEDAPPRKPRKPVVKKEKQEEEAAAPQSETEEDDDGGLDSIRPSFDAANVAANHAAIPAGQALMLGTKGHRVHAYANRYLREYQVRVFLFFWGG